MDTEDPILLLAAAPAIAYREYLYRPDGQLADWIDGRFDVVARPGEHIGQRLQEGDVLLEVALGRLSPGRCNILAARDLQLMAPGQWLAHGQLVLRPRRRVETSEPLPVEPAGQDDTTDTADAEHESGDDSSTQGGQLVLPQGSVTPDLVLRWNAMTAPRRIDVVVHFHGNNNMQKDMHVVDDILAISGLDFADPDHPSIPGRQRPTLAILPRGEFIGNSRFRFPSLVRPGGLDKLIDDCLRQLADATGVKAKRGRLVLTAHSGGGITVEQILAHTDPDPDEIHYFDAFYSKPFNLISWAQRHITRDAGPSQPFQRSGALRALYFDTGTKDNMAQACAALRKALAGAPGLGERYRIEETSTGHCLIPRRYGWRLLADSAATLPRTGAIACSPPPQPKLAPPAATTGAEAELFTVQDGSEDLEDLEDLEDHIGDNAAEYMHELMTEAALRGELLLDRRSPAPPAPSPSIMADEMPFEDGQEAAFAEQQPAAPAVATSVDVIVRTDFAVPTATGVRFDWAGGEPVRGARAQIMGTAVSAVSDAHGNLRVNTTGLANGFYTIRIEHTDADQNSPDIAGPALADSLAAPPSRIYRPLNVWVAIVDGHITAAMVALFSPHGGIGNRQRATWDATHLPIDWKPTWMRSPMKSTEAARSTTTIDLVVVHRPDRSDIGPAINTFLSASEVGNAHYLIDHNGHIIKMAEDGRKANHTGFSRWRGNSNLNAISIGIEVMHAPEGFSPTAMAALAALIERLRAAHPTIHAHRVVGHSDIATSKAHPTLLSDRRLEDPGHQFDWALLERRGLGMVPGPVAAATTAYAGIFAAGQPAVILRNGDHDPARATPATLGGTARPGFVGNPIGEP